MTGFLVPLEASPDQKTDAQGTDELDAAGDAGGLDDAATPEPAAARVSYLPSSIGASVLVPAAAQQLTIMVRWGDYHVRAAEEDEPGPSVWERTPREERVLVTLPAQTAQPLEVAVPQSGGLMVDVAVRPVLTPTSEGGLPPGTRSVSVFLVNRRAPAPDERSDDAFAFQAQLAIHGDHARLCRALICAAWRARTGMNAWPTCTTVTPLSSPSGTASHRRADERRPGLLDRAHLLDPRGRRRARRTVPD